ncbi:aaa-family atpase [Anaeramoeba flamelloides]|uniref:Aaa-family atpase n=1 Tax=Anaeramoeba flamelloides TaxID=1746091 RepID=A0ABQ8X737_9EUKA|nr:aaa-family atpase [Anaeramoeba flamelloides]
MSLLKIKKHFKKKLPQTSLSDTPIQTITPKSILKFIVQKKQFEKGINEKEYHFCQDVYLNRFFMISYQLTIKTPVILTLSGTSKILGVFYAHPSSKLNKTTIEIVDNLLYKKIILMTEKEKKKVKEKEKEKEQEKEQEKEPENIPKGFLGGLKSLKKDKEKEKQQIEEEDEEEEEEEKKQKSKVFDKDQRRSQSLNQLSNELFVDLHFIKSDEQFKQPTSKLLIKCYLINIEYLQRATKEYFKYLLQDLIILQNSQIFIHNMGRLLVYNLYTPNYKKSKDTSIYAKLPNICLRVDNSTEIEVSSPQSILNQNANNFHCLESNQCTIIVGKELKPLYFELNNIFFRRIIEFDSKSFGNNCSNKKFQQSIKKILSTIFMSKHLSSTKLVILIKDFELICPNNQFNKKRVRLILHLIEKIRKEKICLIVTTKQISNVNSLLINSLKLIPIIFFDSNDSLIKQNCVKQYISTKQALIKDLNILEMDNQIKDTELLPFLRNEANQLKKSINDLMDNQTKFNRFGVKSPNGILLYGPDDKCFNYLLHDVSEELEIKILSLNLKPNFSKGGHNKKVIIKLINDIQKLQIPVILFIKRVEILHNLNDIDTLFRKIEQIPKSKKIIIIATSTMPNMINSNIFIRALFYKYIMVGIPTNPQKEIVLKQFFTNQILVKNHNDLIQTILSNTKCYTSLEMFHLCKAIQIHFESRDIKDKILNSNIRNNNTFHHIFLNIKNNFSQEQINQFYQFSNIINQN